MTDPNTGEVEKTCSRCNFYLREYLLHLMKKTDFVPSMERFFCSGCLSTKKIPPPGYVKVTAVCRGFEQLVTESWADMITFLASCCSAMCSGAKLELPIIESDSHENLRYLVQKLSVALQ